jgi:RHS repeat-associated protein
LPSVFLGRVELRWVPEAAKYNLTGDLGSTTQVTDASGVVTGEYAYDAFGSVHSRTDATTEWSFTGQQEEGTAFGLYNYGARFYSTKLGRFLSADPLVAGTLGGAGSTSSTWQPRFPTPDWPILGCRAT